MLFLHRLAPEYRRRYYVNLAIVVALVVVVTNLWRLGPRNGPLALVALVGCGLLYGFLYPIVAIAKVRPRLGKPAYVLVGTALVALTYVVAGFFLRLPALGLAVILALLAQWALIICYRGIVFPSLFDRNGGMGSYRERMRIVREAKRASRDDWKNLTQP